MSELSAVMDRILTPSAPTQDQVERAKILADDLLQVLRIEYEKARTGGIPGNQAGVYQAGYGTYAPQGQQGGQADPYAGYYVSYDQWSLPTGELTALATGQQRYTRQCARRRDARCRWCYWGRSDPSTGHRSIPTVRGLLGCVWLRCQRPAM